MNPSSDILLSVDETQVNANILKQELF